MADDIEIERLIKMGVLLPESAAETEYPDQVPTKLTKATEDGSGVVVLGVEAKSCKEHVNETMLRAWHSHA